MKNRIFLLGFIQQCARQMIDKNEGWCSRYVPSSTWYRLMREWTTITTWQRSMDYLDVELSYSNGMKMIFRYVVYVDKKMGRWWRLCIGIDPRFATRWDAKCVRYALLHNQLVCFSHTYLYSHPDTQYLGYVSYWMPSAETMMKITMPSWLGGSRMSCHWKLYWNNSSSLWAATRLWSFIRWPIWKEKIACDPYTVLAR